MRNQNEYRRSNECVQPGSQWLNGRRVVKNLILTSIVKGCGKSCCYIVYAGRRMGQCLRHRRWTADRPKDILMGGTFSSQGPMENVTCL